MDLDLVVNYKILIVSDSVSRQDTPVCMAKMTGQRVADEVENLSGAWPVHAVPPPNRTVASLAEGIRTLHPSSRQPVEWSTSPKKIGGQTEKIRRQIQALQRRSRGVKASLPKSGDSRTMPGPRQDSEPGRVSWLWPLCWAASLFALTYLSMQLAAAARWRWMWRFRHLNGEFQRQQIGPQAGA